MSVCFKLIISDVYYSENMPSFYQNERGTFTCYFHMVDMERLQGFGLRRHQMLPEVYEELVECNVNRKPDRTEVISRNTDYVNACTAAFNSLRNTESGTLTVSVGLSAAGKYFCSSWSSEEYFDHEPVIDIRNLMGMLLAFFKLCPSFYN